MSANGRPGRDGGADSVRPIGDVEVELGAEEAEERRQG